MGAFDDLIPGGAAGAVGGSSPIKLGPKELRDIRLEALDKILVARRLRDNSRDKFMATGFGAPQAAWLGGSNARAQKAGIEELGGAGALKKILDMAAANGGKNPLTPMSEGDVKVIGNSVQSLDIGQPDEDFQRNVSRVEDSWTRAFQGAIDNKQDLEQGLKWREREIAKLAGGVKAAPAKAASKPGWTVRERK